MTVFGVDMVTFYLWGLIIFGCLTLFYILLGDVLDGIFDVVEIGPLNPSVVLSFFTIFSATGYILEKFLNVQSVMALVISSIFSFIAVTILYLFVFVPLKSAETSLGYSDDDLKGKVAKVIISIPEDGFGEVVLTIGGSTVSRSAQSYHNEAIAYDTEVLIIDVQKGVVSVTPYNDFIEKNKTDRGGI